MRPWASFELQSVSKLPYVAQTSRPIVLRPASRPESRLKCHPKRLLVGEIQILRQDLGHKALAHLGAWDTP